MNDVSRHLKNLVVSHDSFDSLKQWLNSYLQEEFDIKLGERKLNHKAAALLGFDNYNQCYAYLSAQASTKTATAPISKLERLYALTHTQLIDGVSRCQKGELIENYVETVLSILHSLTSVEVTVQEVRSLLDVLSLGSLEFVDVENCNSIAALIEVIKTLGLPIVVDNRDDIWFSTGITTVHHKRIEGLMYATVSCSARPHLSAADVEVMARQVNALWRDTDQRMKYNLAQLQLEFDGEWSWPKNSPVTIQYSSSFRGRMSFDSEIKSVAVVDPQQQTILSEEVVYRGVSSLRKLAQSSRIEFLALNSNLSLVFDGEAKLKTNQKPIFFFDEQPIIGTAILVRSNDEGDRIDITSEDIELLMSRIRF